jgi:lactococcin 972 family bacteriocin
MTNKKSVLMVGLVLASAIAVGPATVASASPIDVFGSGSEAGGVLMMNDGPGSSGETRGGTARKDDGGGGSFWQWGVGKDDAWSNFFRERRCHGATAVGVKSKRVTGVAGGRYALATAPKARSGNKAYYHNC